MRRHPELYNQHFPVYVGKRLHELSNLLEKSDIHFSAHPLFVSLDYSQADTAADWVSTRDYLTDRFFDVRLFSYKKSENVPHTLHLRDDNPVGDQIRQGLARFVNYYNH